MSLHPLANFIDEGFVTLSQFFVEDILSESTTMLSSIIESHVVVIFCEKDGMCSCSVTSPLAPREHRHT
jgi:hypothetical protein